MRRGDSFFERDVDSACDDLERADWLRQLSEAAFQPRAVPMGYSESGPTLV